MTAQDLKNAVQIARSDVDLHSELGSIDIFDGFGLRSFDPVYVTTRQVAMLVRWQAFNLGGGIDAEALNEIAVHGRRKFIIVG